MQCLFASESVKTGFWELYYNVRHKFGKTVGKDLFLKYIPLLKIYLRFNRVIDSGPGVYISKTDKKNKSRKGREYVRMSFSCLLFHLWVLHILFMDDR